MLKDAALMLLAAPGHLGLLIALVNWSHGLGITSRRMESATALAGLILGVLTLGGAAWMLRSGSASWPGPLWVYLLVCLTISLVVIPAAAIRRARRRPPRGLSRRSSVIEQVVEPGNRDWALRIPGNESLSVEISECDLALPDLPQALDGLSILHLSDFHFSRRHDRAYFERVAELTAPHAGGLVFFSGDLIDDVACLDWILPVFQRWSGGLGRFAVLGNHDLLHQPERVAVALEDAGFRVLDGQWERLAVGGRTLAIGGTFAPWGRPLSGGAPASDVSLVLSHTPDRVYPLSRLGVDLVFAGHNHAGQVRLPLVGPVLMPSLYGRRLEEGFFQVGRSLLHVSRGLGAKHPFRWRCRPQVSVITLHRAPNRGSVTTSVRTEFRRAAQPVRDGRAG